MTDYLVDASVFASRVVSDEHTNSVRVLFDQAEVGLHRLYIPSFGITEVTNVIWKQVRFHNTKLTNAEALIDALLELRFEILPVEGIYKQALQVGIRYQLAIYDSLYIVIANTERYPLITVDKKQATAASAEGVALKAISDFAPSTS